MKAQKTNNYKKDSSFSIIKSNLDIKEFLYKRFTENGLMFSEVIRNAAKMNIPILAPQLSRYLNTKFSVRGGLSEETILSLCKIYGISVEIKVKYLNDFKI